MDEPTLIRGGLGVDDRGEVGFVNDFDFKGVKRFYTIRNFNKGFVRAWHGHKREGKYLSVVKGAAIICGIKIDNWEQPSPNLPIARHVLSDKQPAVLFLPPGYANGFMSLEDDTRIIVFSTSTLDESKGDDIRFPARFWDAWKIEER